MVLLLTGACTGCVREGFGDVEAPSEPGPQESTVEAPEQRVQVTAEAPEGELPPGEAATRLAVAAAGARRDPLFFRIGAGYGALGRVDLTPCRGEGLAAGYVRVRVTFRDDGRVSRAALLSPAPPSEAALECVAEQLAGAAVPRFEGGEVTLSKSFFVADNVTVL